jgi:hypothetical protein
MGVGKSTFEIETLANGIPSHHPTCEYGWWNTVMNSNIDSVQNCRNITEFIWESHYIFCPELQEYHWIHMGVTLYFLDRRKHVREGDSPTMKLIIMPCFYMKLIGNCVLVGVLLKIPMHLQGLQYGIWTPTHVFCK